MAAGAVSAKTLGTVFFAVALVEMSVRTMPGHEGVPPLVRLLLSRLFEGAMVIFVILLSGEGLRVVGLEVQSILSGFRKGLIWSSAFGGCVLTVFAFWAVAGWQPLGLIKTALPKGFPDLVLFFITGGVISPLTEELLFRGVFYGFLKRWGIVSAVLVSSLAFVLAHVPMQGLLWVPALGGVLFAVSYEMERNLMVPITLHSLGNLTIFTLSLLPF